MRSGSQSIAITTYLRPTMSSFSSSPSTSVKGSNSNSRRRWLSLAKPAIGVALAMGAVSAGQANAVVVNVPGYGSWDVTTFTGSYNDNLDKFSGQSPGMMPWLDNFGGVVDFATAVGGQLGFTNVANGQNLGPYFVSQCYGGYPICPMTGWHVLERLAWNGRAYNGPWSFGNHNEDHFLSWDREGDGAAIRTWAVATPYTPPAAAPGPLPALGAAAAFGFSRKLRKRIKCSTNTSASL
jgi:hypothetical protein